MGLPAHPLTAAPATPLPGGLYSAATMIDSTDTRHMGGLTLISPNGQPHGTWPADCPAPDGTPGKGGARPTVGEFPAVGVWAADECATVGVTDGEATARAEAALQRVEVVEVERHLAPLLAAVAPVGGPAGVGPVEAVVLVEEHLAVAGYRGVIHAPRHLLPVFTRHHLVRRDGNLHTSPGGHRWAFGSGYLPNLGTSIVGTGPVTVVRGPVVSEVRVGERRNTRLAVAERVVAAGWEPPAVRVVVDAPAPTVGVA